MTIRLTVQEFGDFPAWTGANLSDGQGCELHIPLTRESLREFARAFPLYSSVEITITPTPEAQP